jgi:hypothetical protein
LTPLYVLVYYEIMEYTEKAKHALDAVELTLRAIISDALAANAYGDVSTIAKAVDALAFVKSHLTLYDSNVPSATALTELVAPSTGNRNLVAAQAIPQNSPGTRPRNGDSRRPIYPQFFRDGDRLVKIAWSKKERRPYEHKAPQAIVQALLNKVRKKKGEGKVFEAVDVLPLTNAAGEEYPSYQSYLALAWLRHIGVVNKKGREGYVVKPNAATVEKIEQAWASLPNID